MAQSKYWIGTSFDDEFPLPPRDTFEYLVYQREKCPDSGREHWQFFVVFKTKRRFKGVKTLLSEKVHIEIARCPEKADAYCRKEETRVTAPIQIGAFGPVHSINMVDELRKRSVCEILTENPALWRSVRQMTTVQDLYMRHQRIGGGAPTCLLLTGATGTGKSKIASLIAGYVGDCYFKNSSQWWDAYHQQSLVVWDEFCGILTTPLSELLLLLNHLPHQIQKKGGSVYFVSPCLVMTSNLSLSQLYPMANPLHQQALSRRIKELHVY